MLSREHKSSTCGPKIHVCTRRLYINMFAHNIDTWFGGVLNKEFPKQRRCNSKGT